MNKMITNELITIKEACEWATNFLEKKVTTSNISYLIQYGRIKKFGENGNTMISIKELENYYLKNYRKQSIWKDKLGEDLNWALSFDNYTESETTKHVHRLHPYKGKFIPQLVEYFLDEHVDNFKKDIYFKKGDIVLDPFAGSGTTLVQAMELGINSIGIEISEFNTLISNCKLMKYNIEDVQKEINNITENIEKYIEKSCIDKFEKELLSSLYTFNNNYFPVPSYKYKVKNKLINEEEYSKKKESEFLIIYEDLINKYNIKLLQNNSESFLDQWYINNVREEIEIAFEQIKKIKNIRTKKILSIILSRTIRSCRATTHSDLATLIEPITTTYYCKKHGKICKPIYSILKWWLTYSKDTINRINQYDKLKTDSFAFVLNGDSRNIDLIKEVEKKDNTFAELIKKEKIKGIFSSPPYIGLIDYHEQHAYAYDLFGFKRNDKLEIGAMAFGQGREAQNNYINGISDVLNNLKKYLSNDYNVFLVANDKYNLYPTIAEKSNMIIVNQFKRPVLNRTEKDKNAYSEIIFHFKENKQGE